MTQTQSIILNVEDSLNIIKTNLTRIQEFKDYVGIYVDENDISVVNSRTEVEFQVKRINLLLENLALSTY